MPDHAAPDALTIDGDLFEVVVNDLGEYSIWPAAQPVPQGWRATGFSGDADACSAHVDEVWTAMRRD